MTEASLAERAHRPAYTFVDGARLAFAGSIGLRTPWSRSSCRGSFLVVLLGKEHAVLAECLGFLVRRFFSVHALSYGFRYIRRSVLRVGQFVLRFC